MKRIDELIDMHEEILRKEEPIIISKLRMINNLYPECKDSDDAMLFDEIIKTFADIVELQKEMIEDLRTENNTIFMSNSYLESNTSALNYSSYHPKTICNFETDEEIQAAFTYYLSTNGKKPLSSYTINDYCSRIKNLWKSFYKDFINGLLPNELEVNKDASLDKPLLNAYRHIDELNCYVGMMSANSNEKRNWSNIGAALNKFIDFIKNTEQE